MRSILLAALVWGAICTTAFGQTLKRVRIDVADAPSVAQQLLRDGFDVLTGSITQDSFEIIVSDTELEAVTLEGYEPEIIDVGRPFRDIQAERQAALEVPVGYPELAEIITEMNTAAAAYPALCQVVDLTTHYGTSTTVEGRHLYAMKVSENVTEDEDEPAFLLVGNHHAREIVTPVIALYLIEQLTTQYGIDPTITDLVDSYEIWIAPVWNPDGYEYVFTTDDFWRKNRRVFTEGVGVDLNRNYPVGWQSPCSGSTIVTAQDYRGPSPASEAETQTMIALAADLRFAKVTDLHSSGREVRYGAACLNHPFIDFLLAEATDLSASVTGYGPATSCCTGGDFGYHQTTNATHAFLWETALTFQPAFAEAEAEAAMVFDGIMTHLQRPISLSGHVTDAVTGDPVVAEITYIGVTFENGERNASHERFGRYHVFLPAGTYDIAFAADGYVPETYSVAITADTAQTLDVALTSLPVPAVSDWGLVVMVLLVLSAGTLALRRARTVTAG